MRILTNNGKKSAGAASQKATGRKVSRKAIAAKVLSSVCPSASGFSTSDYYSIESEERIKASKNFRKRLKTQP
jgi:hypothetical protein